MFQSLSPNCSHFYYQSFLFINMKPTNEKQEGPILVNIIKLINNMTLYKYISGEISKGKNNI